MVKNCRNILQKRIAQLIKSIKKVIEKVIKVSKNYILNGKVIVIQLIVELIRKDIVI